MNLKKYTSVILNPKTAYQYAKKYVKNYVAVEVYKLHKKLHISEYALLENKINKLIPNERPFMQVFLNRTLTEIDSISNKDDLFKSVLEQAEKGLSNSLLILNKTRSDMFDSKRNQFRWHDDFFQNYTYKLSHFSRARKKNNCGLVDIKMPWEMSRMQYLFSLGLAYRFTKEEKYAYKLKAIIEDFLKCNDFNEGPNWNVSMEVGIRIANIVLGYELIQDSRAIDMEFYKKFCLCVYSHRKHILENLENIGGKTSNHFLGDILGLAASVTSCPFLPDTPKIKEFVINSIHHELVHQIQKDGSDFEGSTSYHRLVGELLCFSIIAANRFGFTVSEKEKSILEKMALFDLIISMHNGLVPQIGDNDSGRVFQLKPENNRNHVSFRNLVYSIIKNEIIEPNYIDGFICFYNSNISIRKDRLEERKVELFEYFKIVRYKGSSLYVSLTAGNPEEHGMSGHTHNDLLSFTLEYNKQEIVVDPGTGEYTGNPEIRNLLRGTSSHATVQFEDQEQRDYVLGNLFYWDSNISTRIGHKENEDNIILYGTYTNVTKKQTYSRQIVITKDERSIEIFDELDLPNGCYKMTLPLHPNVEAVIMDSNCIINDKCQSILVGGTWNIKIRRGLYSEQYHETQDTIYLVCESKSKRNTLKFSIL